MINRFKKGDKVRNKSNNFYTVQTVHKDGTYTVRGYWGLDDSGNQVDGLCMMDLVYRHVTLANCQLHNTAN